MRHRIDKSGANALIPEPGAHIERATRLGNADTVADGVAATGISGGQLVPGFVANTHTDFQAICFTRLAGQGDIRGLLQNAPRIFDSLGKALLRRAPADTQFLSPDFQQFQYVRIPAG